MPDRPLRPEAGPGRYLDPNHPASRSQNATIAQLACELLGIPAPTTRLAATYAEMQLRMALDAAAEYPKEVPDAA